MDIREINELPPTKTLRNQPTHVTMFLSKDLSLDFEAICVIDQSLHILLVLAQAWLSPTNSIAAAAAL